MRSINVSGGLRLVILTVLVFSSGQATSEGLDSAEWWTLTDALEPAELRAIHQDPALHRKRYEEAVRAGYREKPSVEKLSRVSYFLTGETTPELFPMWMAFNALSVHLHGTGSPERNEMVDRLTSTGLSQSIAERIVQAAVANAEESVRLGLELHPQAWAFVLALENARNNLGRDEADRALADDRLAVLALAASQSPKDMAEWKAAWDRDPVKEVSVETLKDLRAEFSAEEWELLRTFLHEHIAPKISIIDFANPEIAE